MRTIAKELYTFDELDERAQERARDWYRERVFNDSCDWECIYEDAATIGKLMGIDLNLRRVTLMNGSFRYDLAIYFSGFSSQGDGCNFEAEYRYAKGGAKKVREYAPQDRELHRIADELQEIQRKYFYKLTAYAKPKGRYFDMDVEVYYNRDEYRNLEEAEDVIRDLLQDFASWIYYRLRDEYEAQSSDEGIKEILRINEYEFDEDGRVV